MPMDSSPSERARIDPSKCSKLSMEEKRELVYKLSKSPQDAAEKLQSWSRQEILQILCGEMGKERKYTGLTKSKIIEHLLKIVSEKRAGHPKSVAPNVEPQDSSVQRYSKRQRKNDYPSRIPPPANIPTANNGSSNSSSSIICKNSACKATLSPGDAFCKRCSCCICAKFDDNKDPSLWLTCSSEPPFPAASCSLSCHLECALKHESSGINKYEQRDELDGCYNCIACGKVNDLLGCWRRQMMIAKDARRVDILCYRISLSQKLLHGTKKYEKLNEIVGEAVKKLEAELGPLTGSQANVGRGIVNRLASGPDVQKLCSLGVESLNVMLSESTQHPSNAPKMQDLNLISPDKVIFQDVCPTSLTVILGFGCTPLNNLTYTLWHRKTSDADYPAKPSCTLFGPNARFVVSGLSPASEYYLKVVAFNGTTELGMCEVPFSSSTLGDETENCSAEKCHSPVTNCSSLSNPSSVEDESHIVPYSLQNDSRVNSYHVYRKHSDTKLSADLANNGVNPAGMIVGETSRNHVTWSYERVVPTVNTTPSAAAFNLQNKPSSEMKVAECRGSDNEKDTPVHNGMECVPYVGTSRAGLPITPCKSEMFKDGLGMNERSKSSSGDLENGTGKGKQLQDVTTSKKISAEMRDDNCTENGPSNKDFEYYVKVIRWLEREGHIDKNFRQKFLTWYSLRATEKELRVVKVFVDTFIEDPPSLAGQLIDAFSDRISNKKPPIARPRFCMKLWH